jgi:hypothetical protein
MAGEILQHLPIITGAAGYVAGQLMEQKALKDIAQNRQALFEAHKEAGSVSERQSIMRRAVTTLALMGATTGYVAGETLKPNDSREAMQPELSVAVDHNYSVNQGDTFKKINTIADRVADSGKLRVIARVAHNGTHQKIRIEELGDDTPYGPPSMREATPASMDDVYNTYNKSPAVSDSKEKYHAGVLIVTNGNRLGQSDAVVKQSKSKGELPVFIANTDNSSADVNRELKDVAKRTGGHYWGPGADAGEISDHIEKRAKARPVQGEVKEDSDRAMLGVLALVLGAVTSRLYARRKTETAVS